jgi:hypothetical protein
MFAQIPPPTAAEIRVESTIARPDNRDRIQTSATYLGDGFRIGLSHGLYKNPDIQRSSLSIEFQFSDRTSATVGAAMVEGDLIPEIALSSILVDESNGRLLLYVERGLNDDDPRAIASLIQRNVIGASVKIGDVSTKAQVSFNSDGVEVYENWLSIPLTDNGMLTLNNYVRLSSNSSQFYWSPSSFVGTGLLIGIPIEVSGNTLCHAGVQPGVILNEGRVDLGATIGSQCSYQSDRFSLTGGLSYGYGFSGRITAKWVL